MTNLYILINKMNQIIEIMMLLITTFIFGFIYSKLDNKHFGFKETIDPYYFSLTTMTTVGYGDYSPKTTTSKLIVMTHQIFLLLTEISLLLKVFGYI
tara:strand:+ start:880 stop:1170 length:291 start_codon:yes stop_codon:yes gene_type:complete